jgi:uncharacterized membrane protein
VQYSVKLQNARCNNKDKKIKTNYALVLWTESKRLLHIIISIIIIIIVVIVVVVVVVISDIPHSKQTTMNQSHTEYQYLKICWKV